LPVFFVTKALVTSSSIALSEKEIDFGKIYVGQKSTKSIFLRNTSMLPQKIAFVRLKKEFSVQPNDGFAVLLPMEEMEFEISFGPLSAIEYKLDLTLQTSFNDKYIIPIIAEGVEPPITLSNTVIRMRTTAPGQKVLESVFITNNLSIPQSFEIMPPDYHFTWIKISPMSVNLQALQTCRVEIEFCPPSKIVDVEIPSQFFSDLENEFSSVKSPFENWEEDEAGWAIGQGLYGEVQWSVAPHAVLDKHENITVDVEHIESEVLYEALPKEEWGVIGKWNFPVLVKSKKRTGTVSAIGGSTMTQGVSTSNYEGTSLQLTNKPLPLFISLETMTTLPQMESDIKELDFGSIAVATRQLKTFKIYNRSNRNIKLKTVGFNAMGPFTLLRPIRSISPMESRIVVVECFPRVPGLIVEMLEIMSEDETIGGHRLYIPCSVQGLMPMIALERLLKPPSPIASAALSITHRENWSSRSGLLDFGNVLVTSVMEHNITIKKFTVANLSSFPIETIISRTSSHGINGQKKKEELIERTASGLPIIAVRPERVTIAPGSKSDIEVIFRPDRSRFIPFREDFDVAVGETDERLRVGIVGRAWNRQFMLIPDSPLDEPLMNNWLQATVGTTEDVLSNHFSESIRSISKRAQDEMFCRPESSLSTPVITLKYSDPFDKDIPADSYILIDPQAQAVAAKGKGKDAAPPVNPDAAQRRQIKKLRLFTSKAGIESANLLPGAKGPSIGSFEIILSDAAKSSGIWSFSMEKGNITAGKDEIVEVLCTQAKPRLLGGVSVCSWKTFDATVIVKGGIFPSDEKDEIHIPIKLLAFVSI
jgi:hypothetical protein